MKVHYFQHVSFEGLAALQAQLINAGATISGTHWYQGQHAPSSHDYDILIVMGGPMGVADTDQYPWLAAEKLAIKDAIACGKKVLGICLGAQLIADVLGAKVTKNTQREIGWFEVQSNEALLTSPWSEVFPETFTPLHWHGDTFSLPERALLIGSSEVCVNQGFIIDDKIIGLQFHLELEAENVVELSEACANEFDGSSAVQSPTEILDNSAGF